MAKKESAEKAVRDIRRAAVRAETTWLTATGHARLRLTWILENLNVHVAERVFGNDSLI